jgi:hypothetical protein
LSTMSLYFSGKMRCGQADKPKSEKRKMLDLKTIFSNEQPPVPTTPAATAPEPLTTTRGDGRPDNLGDQASGPTSIPERTSATIPAAAIDATAGQVEGLGDLLPATGEWDELPEPEPCPTCGGIDCWWGLWDERRCERCEPSGQRSLLLANRAARLRERTASGRR